MKKNLILAVAAVLAVGQSAHAAGGAKDGKSDAIRGREVETSRADAAKAAGHGADAAPTQIIASLKAAKLTTTLDARGEADLGRAMSTNPEVMTAVKETLGQAKNERYRDLAAARVGALANLKDIKTGVTADALAALSTDAKKEQAYATLALRAGKAAETWDAATIENLTFLLVKANEGINSGKTIADAMTEATSTIAKSKEEGGRSVRLNLDDVNKFCK